MIHPLMQRALDRISSVTEYSSPVKIVEAIEPVVRPIGVGAIKDGPGSQCFVVWFRRLWRSQDGSVFVLPGEGRASYAL